MQFAKNQLKRCKYGWMLFNGPYIGKCFELYGQYSEAKVRILRHFIRAGDTAIDIGANIGDLYWHPAPIFEPDNFYGNPVNHWAPRNIMSLMVLAVADEKSNGTTTNLKKIAHRDEWWE